MHKKEVALNGATSFFIILNDTFMIRILYPFIYLFLCASCQQTNKQQASANRMMQAKVTFTDSIHKFGTLSGDSLRSSYDFIYTNNGDVPAVILSATPSCKCTSVEYSKEPVMPGKSGKITVIYDGRNDNPGFFNKSVRIRFNAPNSINLWVQGKCTH